MFTYFFWLVAFIAGVAISYFVPETTVSIGGKFIFVGAWGAVLGLVLYNVCKRKLDIAEEDFNEALYSIKDSKLSMTSELPVTSPDPLAAQPEPEDMPLLCSASDHGYNPGQNSRRARILSCHAASLSKSFPELR